MATQRVDIEIRAQDAASGVFAKVGKSLEDLKHTAGGRGPIKDIFELFAGGGAVIGLTFGARILGEMAESAAKVREEFEAGTINAGQMADRLAQSIPIVAQFRQAGLAIRELFTGEEAAARKITEEAQRTNDIIDMRAAAIKQQQGFYEENLKTIRQLRAEVELIGVTPFQKAAGTVRIQATSESEASAKLIDKQIADAKAESSKTIGTIRQQAAGVKVPDPFTPGFFDAEKFETNRRKTEERDREIKDARDKITAALNSEIAERARAAKEISTLELQKFETLNLIGKKGLKEQQELFQQSQEQARKDQQEADQKRTDSHIAQLNVELEKVMEKKKQAAIEAAQEFGDNLEPIGDLFDPKGAGFLQAALRKNRERLEGRGTGESRNAPSLFAESISSRFIAGTVGDPGVQFARQQLDENRKQSKLQNDLLDVAREIKRAFDLSKSGTIFNIGTF